MVNVRDHPWDRSSLQTPDSPDTTRWRDAMRCGLTFSVEIFRPKATVTLASAEMNLRTSVSFQGYVLYTSEFFNTFFFLSATRCNKKNIYILYIMLYERKDFEKKWTLKNIFLPIIGLSIPFVSGERYFLHRHRSKRYLGDHTVYLIERTFFTGQEKCSNWPPTLFL